MTHKVESSKPSTKGVRKSTPAPPKSQKRGFEVVSPASPDSAVPLSTLRAMFQEFIEPVTFDLDSMKKSLQTNSEKLDNLAQLTEKCSKLEAENIQLKDKLQKTNLKCEKLEERIIFLEVASRRNNMKFIQQLSFGKIKSATS